ncbi:MAG: tellurite resistance/C4-dicarboxylate transporter family protein [Acidobacteria bacterium]|nr:tellurite resistance/C4-dicarboxylate transporter family protein [Acidobacteriota bacterium]
MRAAADLFPGYFSMVMATGITSVAANLMGYPGIAWALLYVNIVAFAVLAVLFITRIIFFFDRIEKDLIDHLRGPGFLTVVAGCCVLGSQLILVAESYAPAVYFWVIGFVLWIIITYAFFTAMTIREGKPPLEKGISGTWLIATVATQSVSVLGTLLAAHYRTYSHEFLFFTLCMFFIGCMLYLILITLIFYRFTFLEITRENLGPPYWINMGAVAITTLAASRLILAGNEFHLIGELVPFLKGFTLFFWAAGSWWVPLLVILGLWRHVYKKLPIRYDPQYWSMVFPLGMYTVCTFQLSKALDFPSLMVIPQIFVYAALIAWSAAFIGLIYSLVRNFTSEQG